MSEEALEPFFDDGWIEEIIRPVKSGKEATVYLCRAGARTGEELLAAKIYRAREDRAFRNDAVYWEGGMRAMSRRTRVAASKRSTFGKSVLFGTWIHRENETLERLHAAGALVPRPLVHQESALLMTWIGDEEQAAPQLRQVRFTTEEAETAFSTIVGQVELWLANDTVHADLSEYNILYWEGRPTVIDFPQAVDARFNRNALDLLQRDLGNVGRYFERFGLRRDTRAIASDLWQRWLHAELGVGEGAPVE
ncbi:MAG: serine protein kinase RIO [Candidatus Dormibacteraceae bacterium]